MRKAILTAMLACALLQTAGCAQLQGGTAAQPSTQGPATEEMQLSSSALVRLDEFGTLYFMDYTKDYYGDEVLNALWKNQGNDGGCSTFFTYSMDGHPLTCRNYDYPHRISKEDRTLTGLNIVVHCKHKGKYESIAIGDAIWCDRDNPLMRAGGPDEAGFDLASLDILPYQCTDGVNEKGLTVAVLKLDHKEDEQVGRIPAGSSIMLRHLLDDCANVEEVVSYIDTSEIRPEDWQSEHIFVADSAGNHVVIESRNGEVSVVETDVVTNFFVSSDDIEDSYRNGKLREEAVELVNENGESRYSYGYGHGYHRFAAIASQLGMHQDMDAEVYRTRMDPADALVILQSVVQNEHTLSSGTSMTQYSCIYDNAERTVTVWPFQDFTTQYCFDVTGVRLDQ